jgi:hypothetical protein
MRALWFILREFIQKIFFVYIRINNFLPSFNKMNF